MRLRYRLVLPLAALYLALAIAPALAARPAVTPVPSPVGTVNTAPQSACQLGQPGLAFFYSGGFFYPPDDAYYTLIDPANSGCPTCTFGLKLTAVHWFLYWPQPCTVPVKVSIVGTKVKSEGCLEPDVDNVLCPEFDAILDGTSDVFIEHIIPLSHQCLTEKAFVCIKMVDSGDCPLEGNGSMSSPAVVSDASPDLCVTYNIYPGSGGPLDVIPAYGFDGNFSMWVDADCCPDQTPTLPGTWGRLKTLYR